MKKFVFVSVFFLANLAAYAGPFGKFEGEYQVSHLGYSAGGSARWSLNSDGSFTIEHYDYYQASILCDGKGRLTKKNQIRGKLNCTISDAQGNTREEVWRVRINVDRANPDRFGRDFNHSVDNGRWKKYKLYFVRQN